MARQEALPGCVARAFAVLAVWVLGNRGTTVRQVTAPVGLVPIGCAVVEGLEGVEKAP